jgi:hypothetical protein
MSGLSSAMGGHEQQRATHVFVRYEQVEGGEPGVDQNKVPNILLANEPSLSTNWAGGTCGS